MVSNKDRQIDQPHGCQQAWMACGPLEDGRIRRTKELYELTAQFAKLCEEIVHVTPIVIGFVRATVRQVSRFQLGFTGKDLPCSAQPQWLEVDEVADVFLH